MSLDVPLLLLQVAVILAVARLAGRLFAGLGQPRVVAEMAAGLLLGPSVFGVLAPGLSDALFPAASLGFLVALSQVGLIFFMFLVGLELDIEHVRSRGRSAVIISQTSIIVPFALGGLLAFALYGRLAPPGVGFAGFALFVGAAMSVTAFPVLARILTERSLARTPIGAMAIACAAVDDVSAWVLLAAVVMLVRGGSGTHLAVALGGTLAWVAFVLTLGRRALRPLAGRTDQGAVAMVVLAVLVSAFVTERLGVHALFGAFLAGTAMPRDAAFVSGLRNRFEDVMTVLFLPLFFAVTGLRTRVGLIHGAELWLLCGAVTVTAIGGKLAGTAVAARFTGFGWRDAGTLGVLMNTRGLMELVILTVGLDIGAISSTLFAMMVLMALVTTLMTSPLVAALHPAQEPGILPIRRAS